MGAVNERTNKLHKLRTLHLFAGAGGGILADILLGHQPVCAVEIEPYCQQVLHARQQDGILPWFPIFADVKEFDGKPWRGKVDVVCCGFPCQDISCAGKGAGIDGERSGLWNEFARIIGEVRPAYVLVENSPMLTFRGLGRVLGDLAAMGFDAKWGVLGSVHVGHPHERKRLFVIGRERERERERDLAYTNHLNAQRDFDENIDTQEWKEPNQRQVRPCRPVYHGVSYTTVKRPSGQGPRWVECDPAQIETWQASELERDSLKQMWGIESLLGRVAYGVANRMDRLKAVGNGQDPWVVKLAWETLT